MDPRELTDLIFDGESSKVEFKRKVASPIKIAKEISAFANTKGGKLIVGVDDDGTIYGIASEKSVIDRIETACQFFIDPPVDAFIEVVDLGRYDVVVAHIKESEMKPHNLVNENGNGAEPQNKVYIRMGEKSVLASREMIRLLRAKTDDKPVRLIIGDKEKRLFAYLEKYERATVQDFSKLVNISRRRAERLMIRLVRAGVLQIHNDDTRDYFTLL